MTRPLFEIESKPFANFPSGMRFNQITPAFRALEGGIAREWQRLNKVMAPGWMIPMDYGPNDPPIGIIFKAPHNSVENQSLIVGSVTGALIINDPVGLSTRTVKAGEIQAGGLYKATRTEAGWHVYNAPVKYRGVVSPDWNETDPNADGFIKNKFSASELAAVTPVQRDWNEASVDDLAFVKNKYTLPEYDYALTSSSEDINSLLNKPNFPMNGPVQRNWLSQANLSLEYIRNRPFTRTYQDITIQTPVSNSIDTQIPGYFRKTIAGGDNVFKLNSSLPNAASLIAFLIWIRFNAGTQDSRYGLLPVNQNISGGRIYDPTGEYVSMSMAYNSDFGGGFDITLTPSHGTVNQRLRRIRIGAMFAFGQGPERV